MRFRGPLIGLTPGIRAGGSLAPDGSPINLIATVDSDTAITLNWTIGSTNHDGHRIYISTDGVTFTENSTVLGSTATKQVTGLTAGTDYWFYVVAYKGSTESAASNIFAVLNRSADIAEASGYIAVVDSGTDLQIPATGRWVLNINNETRIRQSGNITQVKLFYQAAGSADVYIQIYRKDGATYDLVSDIKIDDEFATGGIKTITLATPVPVLIGDYVAIGAINISNTGSKLLSAAAGSIRYIDGAKPATTDVNFAGGSPLSYICSIKAYMQAPMAVLIGDSIIAGHPVHYSYIENSLTDVIANSIGYQLSAINPLYINQNMGVGSQTTNDIVTRFTKDVIDLKPKIAIINGGVNDISGGIITKATFLANYKTMLDACATAGIIPVVCKVLPWTAGTNIKMQTRDDWMTDLQALVATYTGSVWVDFDTDMGKFRVGGDAGNLWDLQTTPDYNEDNVHPTLLGYAKMAELIDAAISSKYVLS